MRIYISGPITNMPDHNVAAFDAAESRLLDAGHFVVNPHYLTTVFGPAKEIEESFKILYSIDGKDGVWEYLKEQARLAQSVMDADLAAVRSCNAIYLLKGWEDSDGARKELAEAIKYGLEIMQEGAEARWSS